MRIVGPYFRKLGQAGGRCESSSGRYLDLYIRKQIGLLLQRMSTTNQGYGKKIKTLIDGTQIEIQAWKTGTAIAKVIAAPLVTTSNPSIIYEYYSGLACIDDYAIGGPFQTIPPDEGNLLYYVNLLERDPNASGWTRSGWKGSDKWNLAFANEDDFSSWTPFPDSLVAKKSSSYSGEMRKVVQILAGTNGDIFYEYSWPKTHGIFINEGTEERWVVEISSSGIIAWPLVTENVELDQLLTYFGVSIEADLPIPYLPKRVDQYDKTGSRVLSTTGVSLSTVYEGQPWSEEIGWAFSYSGHEAQNIVLKDGFGTGGYYSKAFRYKIEINTNTDGDPVSATISEMESEWAWYDDNGKNIRIPIMTPCGPAQKRITLATEDTSTCPTTGSYTFPIHVWYDETTNNERVVRYRYSTAVIDSPADKLFPTTGLTPLGTHPYQSSNSTYWDNYVKTTRDIQLEGVSSSIAQASWNATFSLLWTQEELENYPYTVSPYRSDPAFLMLDCCHLRLRKWTTGSHGENYKFSFVIPWGEREGYLLFESLDTNITANSETTDQHIVGRKRHNPGLSAFWQDGLYACAGPGWGFAAIGARATGVPCSSTTLTDPEPPFETLEPYAYPNIPVTVIHASEQISECYSRCTGATGIVDLVLYYPGAAPTELPYISDRITANPNSTETVVAAKIVGHINQDIEDIPPEVFHGVYDEDNASCNIETPWWMLQMTDVFSPRALLKATAEPNNPDEPTELLVLGVDDPYEVGTYGLPTIGLWSSAWFGVPHADKS
jgi:hypothetical protein